MIDLPGEARRSVAGRLEDPRRLPHVPAGPIEGSPEVDESGHLVLAGGAVVGLADAPQQVHRLPHLIGVALENEIGAVAQPVPRRSVFALAPEPPAVPLDLMSVETRPQLFFRLRAG